jgi:hypothetical protein
LSFYVFAREKSYTEEEQAKLQQNAGEYIVTTRDGR